MSHQEKQRIFDEYGIQYNKGDFEYFLMYNLFEVINNEISIASAASNINDFVFAACDLVQEEQQKRIAEKSKIIHLTQKKRNLSEQDRIIGAKIDKASIINPENLLK